MAEIGYSITAKLIEVLASQTINEICRLWNYESQLETLKQTVSTIQKVFLDADAKWDQLNNQDKDFILKLKDAVYDAEDVFDEFRTRAALNQLGKKSKVRKFFGKVRAIFSPDKHENQVYYAYKVSRDVQEITERLDAIATQHKLFELKFDNKAIVERPKDTCSYIDANKIIGRDLDKVLILNMLLDPNVRAVAIVGMGGLGKTALAQLVFNDEKILQEFSADNRHWVCVADQEGVQFDVKAILCKTLESVTREKSDGNLSLESVKNKFQDTFKGRKYFLVLDDVWNEDRDKWVELEEFLRMGKGGSKFLVTTRSEQTAHIMENKYIHRLDGLSAEDSQRLFEMSAFGEGEKKNDFVEVAERIVEKCHRNPLAIKVIGSLLFGQELSKWESIEKSGLAEISKGSDKIMSILKLSYNRLTPSLKSCFSYCALFPKDEENTKEFIIHIWMSQGYIVPFDGSQSIEDAAEEYFMILVRRCFFQDIKEDSYGNVKSVKIHDLMHDVAQIAGKEEICVVTSMESNLGEKIRHVNVANVECARTLMLDRKIRSFMCVHESSIDMQLENMIGLRALVVFYSSINKSLPQFVNKLLLLRLLYLRDDYLEVIPDSFTKLYNLEILLLYCEKLREFRIDISKLVNLRCLDVSECTELNDMPRGIDKLTRLRALPYFVTGGNSDNELKVLQVHTEIKGRIKVNIRNNYRNMDGINEEGERYLKSMRHLTTLKIEFEDECGNSEDVLRKLEPPPNLKGLKLSNYPGTTIPWPAFSSQHHIIKITIKDCENLHQISMLCKLPHLKSLRLYNLNSVEYIEDEINNSISKKTLDAGVVEFFPSLDTFEIRRMKKLKGWWRGEQQFNLRLRFPRLSSLIIEDCPNLVSFALCSNPQYLPGHGSPNLICQTREHLNLEEQGQNWLINCGNSQDNVVKLGATIDKLVYLNSLPTNRLACLMLRYDTVVKSLLEVEDAFKRCASTLLTLDIKWCENLHSLSGLEHLTSLEKLGMYGNKNLSISEEDEEPWKSFPKTLRTLEFSFLQKMKSLPIGMRHLTSLQSLILRGGKVEGGLPEWMSCFSSLQSLHIEYCPGITSLPNAIKGLTSLKNLTIMHCRILEERCKHPNGEDFDKIQNIPHTKIGDDDDEW